MAETRIQACSYNQDVEHNEQSPLLQQVTETTKTPSEAPNKTHKHFTRIILTAFVIVFTINLSGQIFVPALARTLEAVYCQHWYQEHNPALILPGHPIDEALCKERIIQEEVSTLRGYMAWWDSLPSLFVAIPFGILADRIGRAWILNLSVTAVFLRFTWVAFVCADALPLNSVYFSSILNIFCGGDVVAEMIFLVIVTDVTPREKLPVIFFRFSAMGQLTKIIGPSLCGWLMKFSPWYPILLALLLSLLSSILTFTIPETLDKPSKQPELDQDHTFFTELTTSLRDLVTIWSDTRLLFLALLAPLRMLSAALDELMQRYVSVRYHWTLANATFLYSIQAGIATMMLFLVLPAISNTIDTRFPKIGSIRKNVCILEPSLILIATGLGIEGFAPTVAVLILGLVVMTLGCGALSSVRSLAGTLVPQEDNGRIFSGLAIAETLGTMVAYPTIAALFNKGLDLGTDLALGLPFYVTSGAVLIVAILLLFVRFER